ncbi:MAG: helix-turn-helix transcriptional regulator [Myxococcaceae bacterium]
MREARREVGLSQEDLAEAANLSRDAVVRLERGERTARIDTAMALAEALGVTPAYLIGDNSTDERLARLGAVLQHADEETYAVVTAVARELVRLRKR